jgi:Na+-transporting NADH:ubiquinone oxidoreductase subunit NqrC
MIRTTRLSIAVALALGAGRSSAFSRTPIPIVSSPVVADSNDICIAPEVEQLCNQRRIFLSSLMSSSAMVFANVAQASLLDDYGADPTDNKQPKKVEQAVNKGKQESSMEPNLRSNYYYPTNKVRYLPRIKKCSDSIPQVALAIGDGDWDSVRDFATVVADDTILPMKLYVSSLTGGGTNVKVGFAKDMMAAAKTFEKNQALLVKSVEKKDAAKASTALENMAEAMLAYRTSGRLLGPDGGGDIPSVDEIRRSTKRFRGEAFEAKVKERDARVAAAAAASK